jgi:serine/threonine-protein kinase
MALKPREKIGKYRIVRRVGSGGFADVYMAKDTVEGISVALKVPHAHLVDDTTLEDFKREVRLTAKLDHPNILPIKTANMIDGRFVIAYPLGRCSLDERLRRRMSAARALAFSTQLLEALAYAHGRRIVHCDVKPDNLILFDENVLRLTDFGIAKVALRTLRAFGSGTVGYVAPEQALGKPSFRSDVFSAGLVIYRMFTGTLPEWPFEWPLAGHDRLRAKVHADFVALLERALAVDAKRRFEDAQHMLETFARFESRALAPSARRTRRRAMARSNGTHDWKVVRRRQFERAHGRALEARHRCERCRGPLSEVMRFCPWCRRERAVHRDEVRFPARCPRCKRGVKSDWRFCAWCYGGLIGPLSTREYADRRYEGRCSNPACERRELLPFARYCPWCNAKVRRAWKLADTKDACRSCGSGIVREFWDFCPWCGAKVATTGR